MKMSSKMDKWKKGELPFGKNIENCHRNFVRIWIACKKSVGSEI